EDVNENWNNGVLECWSAGEAGVRAFFSNTPILQYSTTPFLSMLIFDQLEKNDPQLRVVALLLLSGLGVLLSGLWWVQFVSGRDYQAHLEMQSFRTVRIPAVRGKILDRNGTVLAENRAGYNVSLYLEEL